MNLAIPCPVNSPRSPHMEGRLLTGITPADLEEVTKLCKGRIRALVPIPREPGGGSPPSAPLSHRGTRQPPDPHL